MRGLVQQPRDHPPLAVAELRLAALGEQLADAAPGAALDLGVGVLERHAEDGRETASDGGFSHTHQADKGYGAAAQGRARRRPIQWFSGLCTAPAPTAH